MEQTSPSRAPSARPRRRIGTARNFPAAARALFLPTPRRGAAHRPDPTSLRRQNILTDFENLLGSLTAPQSTATAQSCRPALSFSLAASSPRVATARRTDRDTRRAGRQRKPEGRPGCRWLSEQLGNRCASSSPRVSKSCRIFCRRHYRIGPMRHSPRRGRERRLLGKFRREDSAVRIRRLRAGRHATRRRRLLPSPRPRRIYNADDGARWAKRSPVLKMPTRTRRCACGWSLLNYEEKIVVQQRSRRAQRKCKVDLLVSSVIPWLNRIRVCR